METIRKDKNDDKRELVLKLERFIDNDTIPVIGDEYIMNGR